MKNKVYSKEELGQSALDHLRKKYDSVFVLEEESLKFSENSDNTYTLSGMAHLTEDSSAVCHFAINESEVLKDNFSICPFKEDILSFVHKKMEEYDLDGDAQIDYVMSEEILPSDSDSMELLHSNQCEIYFSQVIDYKEDAIETYPNLIREWMRFLYDLDYKWYFELKEKENNQLLFSLDPGDNGFSSEKDWTDETILKYIHSHTIWWN